MLNIVHPPANALSQVAFVHEYVQLVFEDERLSIYNTVAVTSSSRSYRTGERGFADALVSLIGEHVVHVLSPMTLCFSNNAEVHVLFGPNDVRGPEAFVFHGRDEVIVGEQNAG